MYFISPTICLLFCPSTLCGIRQVCCWRQRQDVNASPGREPVERTLSRWSFFPLPSPPLLFSMGLFPFSPKLLPQLVLDYTWARLDLELRDSCWASPKILQKHPLVVWSCPVGMVVLVTVELQWSFYTSSGTTGEGMSGRISPEHCSSVQTAF